MNKQRAAQLYELADRLSKLDVKALSEQQRQQRSTMIAKLQEEVQTIKEFSPSDDNSDENSDLYSYVKLWYNGDMSTQEDVEKALDLIGWEIGEIESEEGGAFIIKSGDENGDTYHGFTPEELSEGYSNNMSETRSDCTCSSKITDPKCPIHGNTERKTSAGTGSSDNNPSLRKYMDRRAELANRKVPAMAEDFNGEYDDEAGMAKSNLRTMARAVNGLLDTIEDNDNLPEWAQEKLAKAEMMTTSVWDYLLSQKEQGMDPKVQGVAEGSERVDTLVTKGLGLMRGPTWLDAVAAIKYQVGERDYRERKEFYDFFVKQLVDRYGKEGMAETQLTPMWQDDPEHLEYLKRQADISRSTGLAVGDLVTLKDRPGFKGKIVHDWGGGDFTISGAGGGMSQSNNHRANARLIQKIQGVAEAGFPGAPDVEMPPMKPSGDPQRDKLKQEYMDLHREIKSLVDIPYRSDSSPEQKMQAKARIKQLNDRADQIKAILEPRQPPNEWQKKTYGYDDNWNRVGKGIAETKKPSPKLTPVNIKKSETVSEEINKEAYERLQKVFDFSNYKG